MKRDDVSAETNKLYILVFAASMIISLFATSLFLDLVMFNLKDGECDFQNPPFHT